MGSDDWWVIKLASVNDKIINSNLSTHIWEI